jgi:hypothetical protein
MLTQPFYITLAHLIFPWALFWLYELFFGTWKDLSGLLSVLIAPIAAKIKVCYYEMKLTQLKASEIYFAEKYLEKARNEERIIKIQNLQKSLLMSTKEEAIKMMIEVTAEASFQFFLQTIFILPDFIIATLETYTSHGSAMDFVRTFMNWRFISIFSSFLTLSSSYFRIKNLKKEGALGIKGAPVGYTGLLIFLYTTLETICRILVYGQFLYFSSPTGHFEWKTALLL